MCSHLIHALLQMHMKEPIVKDSNNRHKYNLYISSKQVCTDPSCRLSLRLAFQISRGLRAVFALHQASSKKPLPEPLKRFNCGSNKMAWIFYVVTLLCFFFFCSAVFPCDFLSLWGSQPELTPCRLTPRMSGGIIRHPWTRFCILQWCSVKALSRTKQPPFIPYLY